MLTNRNLFYENYPKRFQTLIILLFNTQCYQAVIDAPSRTCMIFLKVHVIQRVIENARLHIPICLRQS